jgi:hypothetical protein
MLIGMLLLASTFAVSVSAASPWEPLVPFDNVSFLIPALSDQPNPTDDVVFSGGRVSEIDVAGCGSGTRAVQQYVIVGLTGTRSQKFEGIIALTTRPVQPNTRLDTLTFDSTCFIGDVLYFRYDGTVE